MTSTGDTPPEGSERRIRGREWYHLEDRHEWLFRGRAVALVLLAAAAAVLPRSASAREHLLATAACLGALVLHGLLQIVPRRRPNSLLLAHDVGLVVDAALIFTLAALSGGLDGLGLWLLPLQALAVTLGYSTPSGIKALILGGIVVGALYALDSPDPPPPEDWLGAPLMAVAVVGIASIFDIVNRRDLARSGARDRAKWTVSTDLIGATSDDEVVEVLRTGAQGLLEEWDVTVGLGGGGVEEKRWRDGGRGLIEVPLVDPAGDAPVALGRVTVSRPLPRHGRLFIGAKDVGAIRQMASDASAALVRIAAVERLEQLSLADPLTGLGNRRAFDEALTEELARVGRNDGRLGLVMIDVDHFKRFNDLHGHQAGDEALIAVAHAMSTAARAGDRACRIGGEEFALLLPGADEEPAIAVAERIRAVLADAGTPSGPVTVSLGVASAGRGTRAEDLVRTADRRLYAAKEAGRDRVESETA
ncbi:MAG: diguanylate cyclase [Thermoleophilia bacterium]